MAAVSFVLLFFLCCLFVIIISLANAAQICDNDKGNYTINSTYHNNLNILLSSFSSHTEINYGFYNFSYGQNPDRVNAILLCRGDVEPDDCLKCLAKARVPLTKQCPNQKEVILWWPKCMLRYSYRSIFGVMENQPSDTTVLYVTDNVTGPVDQFNEVLERLMRNLTRTAASGDSRRKYSSGSTLTPDQNFPIVYGYTQWTPDLSSEDYTKCLDEAISRTPHCCSGKAGVSVTKPSCRIRFQPSIFYGPTIGLPSPSTNNTSSQGKSNTSRTIIATVVPVASVILVLALFCIYLRVRKPRKKFEIKKEEDNYEDEITFAQSLQFDFDTIQLATHEFADSNKLGQGSASQR